MSYLTIGDVVVVRDKNKNWNHWKLGIVTELIRGRDGVVSGALLQTKKDHSLERPIQQLYPLELAIVMIPDSLLNLDAPEFCVRPRRDAAAAAGVRIQEIAELSEQ